MAGRAELGGAGFAGEVGRTLGGAADGTPPGIEEGGWDEGSVERGGEKDASLRPFESSFPMVAAATRPPASTTAPARLRIRILRTLTPLAQLLSVFDG